MHFRAFFSFLKKLLNEQLKYIIVAEVFLAVKTLKTAKKYDLKGSMPWIAYLCVCQAAWCSGRET